MKIKKFNEMNEMNFGEHLIEVDNMALILNKNEDEINLKIKINDNIVRDINFDINPDLIDEIVEYLDDNFDILDDERSIILDELEEYLPVEFLTEKEEEITPEYKYEKLLDDLSKYGTISNDEPGKTFGSFIVNKLRAKKDHRININSDYAYIYYEDSKIKDIEELDLDGVKNLLKHNDYDFIDSFDYYFRNL